MNLLTGQPFDDGAHIFYVNGEYWGDTDIGSRCMTSTVPMPTICQHRQPLNDITEQELRKMIDTL